MSYSKIPYILALSLGYSLLSSAQQADTLKRQLRVLTHQDEEIALRQALPLSYELPKPNKAKPLTPAPTPMRPYMPTLGFEPLSALSPLIPYYQTGKQTGYVTLGGGLRYNAYLSAGVRAIDKSKQLLDIRLSGHYTNHSLINYNQESLLREQSIRIGGDYKSQSDTGFKLVLKSEFQHNKHNYYGYLGSAHAQQANTSTSPSLQTNQFGLSAAFGQTTPQLYSLAYRFKPYALYTQATGASAHALNELGHELQIGIEGELRYTLEQDHYITLDIAARSYSYNEANQGQGSWGYQNASSLALKPYWHYASSDNFDWGVSVGAGLDFYVQDKEKGVGLSPYLEAYAKFSPSLTLLLEVNGGAEINSLSRMLKSMPYLGFGIQAKPTITPIEGKLSLDALLQPEMKLTAFLGYAKHRDALNFLYNEQGLFIPENANGSVWHIGGQFDYRFAPTFNLKGQAIYNHWSKDEKGFTHIYARPQLELLAELTYRPLQTLECIVGVDIKQGVDQAVATTNGVKRELVPTTTLFRLSANYQIHKQWTLGAMAHLLSDALSTRYYGYLPQRFATTFFATYKF